MLSDYLIVEKSYGYWQEKKKKNLTVRCPSYIELGPRMRHVVDPQDRVLSVRVGQSLKGGDGSNERMQ